MSFLFKRLFTFFFLSLLFSVAYLASAATVSINANISGGGGGGIIIPPPPPPAPIPGCTNPLAVNYNPSATVDNGSCTYQINGCTNPLAVNYNPSATVDNGSCIMAILGCTDALATNFNILANQDNGTCVYQLNGCTDALATNYNALATIDDGTCTYQINGCTNPLATNYNVLATIDDGTCSVSGCTNPLATNYNVLATTDNGVCIIAGCTDPVAINFNNQATVDNGSCSYDPSDIPGCTDAAALNFNKTATVDNGSCLYNIPGCTDTTALNFNSGATVNNGTCAYNLPIVPLGKDFEPNYYFFTNNNALELFLKNNNIDLLVGHELLIVVPNNFPKAVKKITALVDGEILLFKYDIRTDQFVLNIDKFNSITKTEISFLAIYDDNSSNRQTITVTTKPLAHIFSKLPASITRIFGVRVLLYDGNNNLVMEVSKISADGTYGFMVKNGRYKLVVFDNGEKVFDGNYFEVKNNIINRDIGLTLLEQIIKIVQEFIDNPVVEQVNTYTAPVVVSIVSVTTLMAIPWATLVSYLQYLFTEPLAWFLRRKKKGWGVVYNSVTKKPIDLAVVRLRDKTTGTILKSRVTDKEGRYNFLVSSGRYTLEVIKPRMVFPSSILMSVSEDRQFTNLYHGEAIEISKDQKGIITANIPVDPDEIAETDQQIIKKNYWYKIKKNINLAGPIFSIFSFIIFPSILIGSFAIVHIGLYLLFKRLVAKEKVNNWGVILDAKTGKPVSGTVTKIYSPEYNKMLETQVTDSHGRYGFLAGNNVYYISASKNGYMEAKTANLDLTNKKSNEVIGQDINLQPTDNQKISGDEAVLPTINTKPEENHDVEDLPVAAGDQSPLYEMAQKINQQAQSQQAESSEGSGSEAQRVDSTPNLNDEGKYG